MAYCVDADVTAAGAAAVAPFTSQIAEAKDRIDRFCGDTFEPTNMTVRTSFGASGVAPLPRSVQSVTQVQLVGPTGVTTTLDPTAYLLRQSSVPGDVDAIELAWGYDDLIVGAERWAGGFLNLARGTRGVLVTGSFGKAAVTPTIKTAAAKLAAWLADNPQYGAGEPGGVTQVAVEGYSATYNQERLLTTGLPEVDRLLYAFQRRRVG